MIRQTRAVIAAVHKQHTVNREGEGGGGGGGQESERGKRRIGER